jgi:hypothetical protein
MCKELLSRETSLECVREKNKLNDERASLHIQTMKNIYHI